MRRIQHQIYFPLIYRAFRCAREIGSNLEHLIVSVGFCVVMCMCVSVCVYVCVCVCVCVYLQYLLCVGGDEV